MTVDMITAGAQIAVTCPACRRRPSLLAVAGDDVLARGRCVCGAVLALVEEAGEDGLPLRVVRQAPRPRKLGELLARRRRETDPL